MTAEAGGIGGDVSHTAGAGLAGAARALGEAAGLGAEWVRQVARSSRRVAEEERSLLDLTRRTRNEAAKLAAAAERRMCIGVFGPSQAGKSYLVSRLCLQPGAEGEGARLLADFGATTLDFLREINPPGDKESTGLVTRFSVRRVEGPADHPVSLRLLSETDLVRILANSYLSDFDVNNLEFETAEQDVAPVRALIDQLRPATGHGSAPLDELAIEDLRHYFETRFKTRFPGLKEVGFWDFAIAFLPSLALADRARLYSVLWGGIAEFTQLFLLLAGWLERLGSAAAAHAALDALTPRERSIIDVDRVKLDLGTPGDAQDPVSVIATLPDGRPVREQVPRAVLCAIVAELHIAMRQRSWPMFAEVDLLDFPGARSREKYRSMGDRAESPEKGARRPYELFIRGKIAVLFQRYAEERELTSMLLCMAGSNAEVKDLGALVREWVSLTHGERPEQRRGQRNALFFVLTKADQDFLAKDGEDEAARRSRWQRRIYASMIELYQRDGWLDDWDGQPFRNTLLLRNPGIEQTHLVAYRTELRGAAPVRTQPLVETGYAPDMQARLPELRQHFVEDPQVRRYIEDPARAFDALLALNDGGIAHIAERVAAVCEPSTKHAQLRGRLATAAETFRRRFGAFYDAGGSASRERKREQAFDIAQILGRGRDGGAALGRLLRSMAMAEPELRELYLTALHDEPVAASKPAREERSIFETLEEESDAKGEPGSDRAHAFAEAAVQGWIAQMRDGAADPGSRFRRDLSADQSHVLVQELISAAQRMGLAARIADEVHAQGAITDADWENAAERAAAIAALRISDFVSGLGYGALPPDRRPQVPPLPRKASRRAFQPPEPFESVPTLADQPRPPAQDFRLDWLSAFVQLAEDNLGFSGSRDIDHEQNAALGRILERAKGEERVTA